MWGLGCVGCVGPNLDPGGIKLGVGYGLCLGSVSVLFSWGGGVGRMNS